MRQSVLYFPHIEIPDHDWLKATLLLWDDVRRIVPSGYHPNDSPEVRAAVDSGLVKGVLLEKQDLLGVTKRFNKFMDQIPFLPHGLEPNRTSLLHPEKVDATLYPLLDRYAIGERNGGWIELPRQIVRGYMFFLSQHVAKRRKLERATDTPEAFSISSYFSEKANFHEIFTEEKSPGFYASLIFEDIIPSSISSIPISEIIKISERTKDERTVFRDKLIAFSESMLNCESEEYAKTVIFDHKADLLKAKAQLKASQGFLGEMDRGAILTMGIPTALTAFGGLVSGGASPFALHTLSASLLISAVAAYADFNKIKASGPNPYGANYLVSLDESFRKNNAVPAFDRYLNEFIND